MTYTDWDDEDYKTHDIPLWEHDAYYEQYIEPKGRLPAPLVEPLEYSLPGTGTLAEHDAYYEQYIEPRMPPNR